MAPRLRIAFGVSIIAQSPGRILGEIVVEHVAGFQYVARRIDLGQQDAVGLERAGEQQVIGPHSLAIGLMRMMISGPPAGRCFMKAESLSRAAAFSAGATASSRSRITASQASDEILAKARSFEAGT